MFFSFTSVSRNRKTGPIPVVTASKDTCPATCPLRGAGCYAEHGPLVAIRRAGELDFHINVSADNFDEADSFARQGLSTVMVLPSDYGRRRKRGGWAESLGAYRARIANFRRTTKGGTKIAICPAIYHDVICAECGACSDPRPNNTIIGFPAHGSRKVAIDQQFR